MIPESIWKEETHSADPKQQNSERIEPVITPSSYIEKFIQQNSPVNNELIRNKKMNDLLPQDSSGKLSVSQTEVTVRGRQGRRPQVTSMCSFSYDDDVDLEVLNKNGRYKITGYDRRVYNAVGTLWLNNCKAVSLNEIISIMNGYAKKSPSAKQLQAIYKSLTKLKSIRFHIDITDEIKANVIKNKDALVEAGILKDKKDKIKSTVIEDNLLHYRACTIISENGKEFKSIQIIDEPILLTYNRAKKTLLSIPMKYIGLTGSNATEKVISFQDYLLMRVISYQNGKLRENKVMYDTIYRDSGVDRPMDSKDFIRDRKTINNIFDEWKNKGLVSSYKEIKKGRSYVGIIFQVPQAKSIEEKKSGE
jgi:hypothetical protein